MKEHTVTAEAGDPVIDRRGAHPKVPGDLPVGHPAHRLHDDLFVEAGEFLPVRGRERL
jgi:hypothetical protein